MTTAPTQRAQALNRLAAGIRADLKAYDALRLLLDAQFAAVLQHHEWRMAPAAQALGIQRPNLYRKARQLGIPLVRVSE